MTDTNANVNYWERQVRAALDQMGVDANVTGHHDSRDVTVEPSEVDSRDGRAHLIHALEIRGFTVATDSTTRIIRVSATDDRLAHDFAEVED